MLMSQGRAAKLYYMANGFRILANGDHVLCAISGAQIPLESLRYWSVALQQPYASPELATRAALGTK
jgi:hypothetical protein